MDTATLLIALQIIKLNCPLHYNENGNIKTDHRNFDFTLDLQKSSGELIYKYSDKVNLLTSNKLIVTPNYVVFPYSPQADITIDRRNLDVPFSSFSGECKVVESPEVDRKI